MSDWHDKNVEIDICAIGKKASSFFSRFQGKIISKASDLGDQPSSGAQRCVVRPDRSRRTNVTIRMVMMLAAPRYSESERL